MKLLRITDMEVRNLSHLWLAFNDGISGEVDLSPLFDVGPVFEPLRDREYFRQVRLDQSCGTVVWPNGADFAPEALHALIGQSVAASQ